jgi:nucleotide-binding universal stress UspA family protein
MLAKTNDAELTLLNMDPFRSMATMSTEPIYIPPQVFEALRSNHSEVVQTKIDELANGLDKTDDDPPIHAVVRRGDVVDGIASYAEEHQMDLIVIGAHGLSGAARMVLGSTSEKLSRFAKCPVLITRSDEPVSAPFQNALVAVDYSDFSAPCARNAMGVLARGARMELFHAWYEPFLAALEQSIGFTGDDVAKAIEEGRAHQVRQLDAFAAELSLEIDAHVYLATGSPTTAILDRAHEIGADLIVLGAHGRKGLEKIIGTVADRVLHNADMPVLLLPIGAIESLAPAAQSTS